MGLYYFWIEPKFNTMGITVTRTFDILDRYMHEFPRKDALGGKKGDSWYTYSTQEYYLKSHQFALGLMALGLQKGDNIATVANNRPEWNFADMGIAMAGMVHVPIYPTIGEEEYRYILHHAGVKMLMVGDSKLYEKLKPVVAELPDITHFYGFEKVNNIPMLDDLLALGESNREKLEADLEKSKKEITPADLATIIYTSGTTGVPKGVMLTQENLVSNFVTHSAMHNLGKDHQ